MSTQQTDTDRRRTRRPLTRDRIVEAAVVLVDEEGPDALTMRAVALRLEAGTMSLYRHVSGREELLDLVLAAMAAEVPVTPLSGDWRTDITAIAHDVRRGLLQRPHLTVLLTSRAGRGLAELPMLDRTLTVLRAAGFGRRGAVMANHVLGNYVAGAALWEAVGLAGETGEARAQRRQAAADAIARLPAGQFPSLDWVGPKLMAGSVDERFEAGLAFLLDGFEVSLARRKAGA